jgi:hypothetical protein
LCEWHLINFDLSVCQLQGAENELLKQAIKFVLVRGDAADVTLLCSYVLVFLSLGNRDVALD